MCEQLHSNIFALCAQLFSWKSRYTNFLFLSLSLLKIEHLNYNPVFDTLRTIKAWKTLILCVFQAIKFCCFLRNVVGFSVCIIIFSSYFVSVHHGQSGIWTSAWAWRVCQIVPSPFSGSCIPSYYFKYLQSFWVDQIAFTQKPKITKVFKGTFLNSLFNSL